MSSSNSGNWENWHKTTNVGGPVQQEFTPNNGDSLKNAKTQNTEFKVGLDNLMKIVQNANTNNARIRAFGSKWSLNNIAYTKDYMVKTWGLNYVKIGLAKSMVTETYQDKSNNLCFVQAGVMIRYLNEALKIKNLSLKTTGASDGQRLVGAISTGTHGSAMGVGAMQDFVKGIHLVVPDGDTVKHIFLQRKSDQAVNTSFCESLDKAEFKCDDELFNAALISFGSFGLIHGVLIETEEIFLLRYQTIRFDPINQFREKELQAVLGNPTRHNLRALAKKGHRGASPKLFDWLKQEKGFPYFVNVTQNPYKGLFPNTFFIQVMEKEYYDREDPPRKKEEFHHALEHEKHEAIHKGINIKIKGVQKLSKSLLSDGIQIGLKSFHHYSSVLPMYPHKNIKLGTPDVIFHTENSSRDKTNSPCPATSTEIAVPISKVNDAVDCIIEVLQTSLLAAPLGIRYLPTTSLATLAINQKFSGDSSSYIATIELPGPQTGDGIFKLIPDSEVTHKAIFEKLNSKNIPHRFHWGQQYPLNTNWVIDSYGNDKVNSWKNARKKILTTPKARNMFANKLTDAIGLTEFEKS